MDVWFFNGMLLSSFIRIEVIWFSFLRCSCSETVSSSSLSLMIEVQGSRGLFQLWGKCAEWGSDWHWTVVWTLRQKISGYRFYTFSQWKACELYFWKKFWESARLTCRVPTHHRDVKVQKKASEESPMAPAVTSLNLSIITSLFQNWRLKRAAVKLEMCFSGFWWRLWKGFGHHESKRCNFSC